MQNSVEQLADAGVAVWLDDLSRTRLRSGDLERLVREQGVRGVTTNPAIFHAAITGGGAYDEALADLARCGAGPAEATRRLTCQDVRAACDVLAAVHRESGRREGWVSIEVDPGLAHDAVGSLAEARLLRWLIDRPNVMIKIPATVECLPTITACLAEGISVNATLIFSVARYEAVSLAFLEGLELARAASRDLGGISSVASFFISRMDSEIDSRLDAVGTKEALMVRGHAAIANARLAYERFEALLATPRWQSLAEDGARPQRLLWASTGVKDPTFDDTRYVIDLVAPDTVNTMPESTLHAVADHGVVRGNRVSDTYGDARQVFGDLAALGIDYTYVVTLLEREGIAKFQESWRALLACVGESLDALHNQSKVA
ncbi:transaldolase [Tomitella biformata]|uniref:transaldolase n=1 Tax=Tomitella biformata TaxID=630403 RepID=UPI000467408D|nr:transaldolase [Tomitella biformata]